MSKMDIDQQAREMFEPLEFTLDGGEYSLSVIPSDLVDKLVNVGDSPAEMRHTLAKLVGVKDDTFDKTDFRKLALVVRYITNGMRDQLKEFEPKNA